MTPAGLAPPVTAVAAAALDAFLESFFMLQPVTATFVGLHQHDHRLPDWSPEGLQAAIAERRRLRRVLAGAGIAAVPEESLVRREWTAIDGALADACLELQIAEEESRHFARGNPSLAVGEAIFSLVALAWDEHRPVAARLAPALSRLEAFPGFFRGAMAALGASPIPASWKERAVRECEGGQTILSDLDAWLAQSGASSTDRRTFSDAAARAGAALDEFRSFVIECGTPPEARYAVGEDLLDLIVRRGHWCDTGLDDLRREAREGLEMERSRLDEMLRSAGAMSWSQVSDRLAANHPVADHVLESCHTTWAEARRVAADQVTWPGIPVQYDPMPAWARRAAPNLYYLLYRSPAPLAYPSADRYAVPVPLPDEPPSVRDAFARTWNRAAIKLNHVAHHGGLGHHVQNWHASRSPSRMGRIAAVDGACRIAMIAGGTMAEGWACYATEVLEHLGFLTPDERISEQHTRLRLMVRAVVDLELHSGRLSFDDGVRLHQEVAGLSAGGARAEVTKCTMFPGTASMYWLGLRGLWRLRRDEETAKGAAFDVRAFHDAVLACGSIPVSLVARLLAAARAA